MHGTLLRNDVSVLFETPEPASSVQRPADERLPLHDATIQSSRAVHRFRVVCHASRAQRRPRSESISSKENTARTGQERGFGEQMTSLTLSVICSTKITFHNVMFQGLFPIEDYRKTKHKVTPTEVTMPWMMMTMCV